MIHLKILILHRLLIKKESETKNKMCRGVRGCCKYTSEHVKICSQRKFEPDTTATCQHSMKINSLVAQPGIGPFGLQRHPHPALMELPDHISQQGQSNHQSRTGQSWRPKVQRPTTKTKACWVVGSLDSREEPSLYINLFQTHKSALSIC